MPSMLSSKHATNKEYYAQILIDAPPASPPSNPMYQQSLSQMLHNKEVYRSDSAIDGAKLDWCNNACNNGKEFSFQRTPYGRNETSFQTSPKEGGNNRSLSPGGVALEHNWLLSGHGTRTTALCDFVQLRHNGCQKISIKEPET
jgi:hypothetical protein